MEQTGHSSQFRVPASAPGLSPAEKERAHGPQGEPQKSKQLIKYVKTSYNKCTLNRTLRRHSIIGPPQVQKAPAPSGPSTRGDFDNVQGVVVVPDAFFCFLKRNLFQYFFFDRFKLNEGTFVCIVCALESWPATPAEKFSGKLPRKCQSFWDWPTCLWHCPGKCRNPRKLSCPETCQGTTLEKSQRHLHWPNLRTRSCQGPQ